MLVEKIAPAFSMGFLCVQGWRERAGGNVQHTGSFIKRSFRLFHVGFNLSVDQSLTVLTQLAYGTVIKGSGPCIFDLDPDLATLSATSLPCTPACPGIQAILT